jgi:hypothetical protein
VQVHFAHHASALLVDWYSEYHGFLAKSWQHGMFTPHPFFTGLILFLWNTDKRRNLAAEERENQGKTKVPTQLRFLLALPTANVLPRKVTLDSDQYRSPSRPHGELRCMKWKSNLVARFLPLRGPVLMCWS